ncbi:MAG: hypothetical protein ACXWM8_00360 [Candidatus Limnocylindrales bacterium]
MTLDSEAAVLARFGRSTEASASLLARFGVVEPPRATLDWFPLDFR